MASLSLPHSLPRSPPPPPPRFRPPFNRFPLFRCSANLRASMNSHNSRLTLRLPAAHPRPDAAKLEVERFASISSSNSRETSSVGVSPQYPVPPQSSNIGSPLFWIGVGVAFSALFSWAASRLKNYAMQQAFKTVMGQMNSQNDQFSNAAFSPGSPFPFSTPPSSPSASPFSTSSQPSYTDVSATRVDAASPATSATSATPPASVTPPASATSATDVKDQAEPKKEVNRFAFVDISPEETEQKSPFESSLKDVELGSSKEAKNHVDGSQNGAAFKQRVDASMGSQSTGKATPVMSVEALEKMLEDPTVQKMVYP